MQGDPSSTERGKHKAEEDKLTLAQQLEQRLQALEQQVMRAEAQSSLFRVRLAERERELSGELVVRDQVARELALVRLNFEVADRTLRVMNQIEDIVLRTSPATKPGAEVSAAGRAMLALRGFRRSARMGMSFLAIERLRRELRGSPLFNPGWYIRQRPDLRSTKQDAIDHFVFHGMHEGTSPNPLLDVDWIARSTRQSRQSALPRYLLHGRYTDLRPTALFDVHHYRKIAGLNASADALSHYLRHGQSLGLSPHPLFDRSFYTSQLPKLARWTSDPFLHYVLYPFELNPHPLFSNEYYLRQHPELRARGISPLLHYLEYGFREQTNPHPTLSGSTYLHFHDDVARAGQNPLLHYATFGKSEGRRIDCVT